ncbi:MAG: MgtC/SapB family protein [Acidobacteriota bacterium]
MDVTSAFVQLGLSLGLGLLVGLERERRATRLAGIRTFPLVTLFGTVCAMLGETFGAWTVAAGLLGVAIVVAMSFFSEQKEVEDPGMTTEAALLLMYGVGALLVAGPREIAIVLGGGIAILLKMKEELHGIAGRLTEQDYENVMRFALITLVLLPVLPDRAYGPYSVLNPHEVWLMVVLIVGINLAGYVAYKLFGGRAGIVLGGILGGLISSTATSVSYARRSRTEPRAAGPASIVILVASAIVFARIVFEIAVVAPSAVATAAPPLLLMLATLSVTALVIFVKDRERESAVLSEDNPSEIKSALAFGIVYAAVRLAVAAGKELLGDAGLYVVAGLSGLTDVDAITLSTSRLVADGRLSAPSGVRVVLLAALSNLAFKGATVAVLGSAALRQRVGACFGIGLAAGVTLLLGWPGFRGL